MMSRIDAIRRAHVARRAGRSEEDGPEAANESGPIRLPVPVGPVERIEPRVGRQDGGGAFAAQLIGQDGAKRGLRAGPEAFDAARSLYNRTEWSGAKDRRARQGAKARTQV